MPLDPNNDIRGQVPAESKTTQKVELVISNQDNEAEQEVSVNLMNVFGNMKKKRGLYVRVIAVFLLIGILVPLFIHQMNESEVNAVAIISFNDVQDNEELPYDVSKIKSGYVISKALDNVFLSKKLSSAYVEGNISIERLITSETRQKYDQIASLAKDATGSDASKLWEGFELEYSNQYVITLKNGFSSGAEGEKPLFIRDNELSALLKAIVGSYSDYLYETYGDYRLPDNILELVNYDTTEYSVTIDYVSEELENLASYCRSKETKYPTFVSKEDGQSFADLVAYVELMEEVDLDWCASYLWSHSVARDRGALLTNYNFDLRRSTLELDEIKESLAAIDSSIKAYERDKVVIASPDNTGSNEAFVTTDYFNSLVMKRLELASQYNKTEAKISDLNDRINKITDSAADSAAVKTFDAKARKLFNNVKELYSIVYSHAEELFETGMVQEEFIDTAYTTVSNNAGSDGVTAIGGGAQKQENLVKNIAIGAAVGVVLAVVIWACDALIAELKSWNGKKKKEDERE